jgi:predicted nucleic acid-binding protein
LRYFVEDDPQQNIVQRAVDRIFESGEDLYFTPQVVREAWSVLTRPKTVGGYSQTKEEASHFLAETNKVFVLIHDVPEMHERWFELVKSYGVLGRQVHDAYHVATMMEHGLTFVLSLNARDFNRYAGISVVHPSEV